MVVVLHGPGDVSVEERERPRIVEPTDDHPRPRVLYLRIRPVSLLGIAEMNGPTPITDEYVGIVEEVGDAVSTIKPGQFVVGSFFAL